MPPRRATATPSIRGASVTSPMLILDHVYQKETERADTVYLTQPVGGGRTVDYTWRETVDQARRMAAHLQASGLQPGDRVAMLSKNCAHFFIAELAIWMGGFTTVAIFPTEKADTIAYVMEHSEAKAVFIGKLDPGWERQLPGIPDGIPRITFPLAPDTAGDRWDAIVAAVAPLGGAPPARRTTWRCCSTPAAPPAPPRG